MNIFKILSEKDGSINEPSITSFLGFLFDPKSPHALEATFLERFLEQSVAAKNIFDGKVPSLDLRSRYNVKVVCEERLIVNQYDNRVRDLDVLVTIEEGNAIIGQFAIENKIRGAALDIEQLRDQWVALKEGSKKDGSFPFIHVVLVPNESEKKAQDMVNAIRAELSDTDESDAMEVVVWRDSEETPNMSRIVKDVLLADVNGEIDPIPYECKYMLKSFVNFIEMGFLSYQEERAGVRGPQYQDEELISATRVAEEEGYPEYYGFIDATKRVIQRLGNSCLRHHSTNASMGNIRFRGVPGFVAQGYGKNLFDIRILVGRGQQQPRVKLKAKPEIAREVKTVEIPCEFELTEEGSQVFEEYLEKLVKEIVNIIKREE